MTELLRMIKYQSMSKEQNVKLKDIETLLNNQTLVILSAVEEKLLKSEERTNRKIEKLINTGVNLL